MLYSLFGTKAFWPVRVRPQPHWVQGNTARPLDISIYEPYSCDTLVSRRLWPSALGRGSVHFGAAACLCTRRWTIEFVSFRVLSLGCSCSEHFLSINCLLWSSLRVAFSCSLVRSAPYGFHGQVTIHIFCFIDLRPALMFSLLRRSTFSCCISF